MQLAAHDVGRLSRTVSASMGAAVLVLGLLTLLSYRGLPGIPTLTGTPSSPSPTAVAALCAAGCALLLAGPGTSVVLRRTGYAFAAAAALIGAAGLVDALSGLPVTETTTRWLTGGRQSGAPHAVPPAAGLTLVLVGTALAVLDLGRLRRPARGRARWRLVDPLLAGAATIALVALVPGMFAFSFPATEEPGTVMSPLLAAGVLAIAAGTALARPEQGPLATAAGDGPAAAVGRRLGTALIALPFVAAVFSAVASRTGMSRPAAAVSTGVVLAGLALLVVVAALVRSLDGADRRQRLLVAALREKQEFADTLLQSMNEAVMVLDAEHRVIEVNRRWLELTGRPAADALGRRPPFSWQTTASDGDVLLRRPDGSSVPVLTTLATIPDGAGQARAHVATYFDITDRKRAEQALAAHAADLERSNDQLREANQRLEAALAFKSDLISMLSHDVAQPVSSIASLAELLTEDWKNLPEEIRLELATKIDKNTRRLISMLNDLTLLFRLDAGSVTARRTPVPVREVVTKVVDNAGPDAADVTVEIENEVSTLADRGHLWHIVQNLLSNAIKYGDAPVEIRAWREPDRVQLVVQDHGKGIPEELVPNLFDRFMRGAGLGLFIVRHLVEANGGSVHYEPAVPHGARLVVTLEPAHATVPAASGVGDRR